MGKLKNQKHMGDFDAMLSSENHAYLEELMDREKIRDCQQRYCNGIDRCDVEMLRSSYWPDAHDVHGDFDGTGEEFIEWVIPRLKQLVCTQHFMGNSLIRIEGSFARVETYTRNWHTLRNAAGDLYDIIHGGRYLDKMEKRGSEWRIIDRLVMFDFVLENPKTVDIAHGFLGNINIPVSTRYPEDALYKFLGGLTVSGCLDER
jgi:hypothetical protein